MCIRICAWCGKPMGETPPLEDKRITHGMCESCLETKSAEANKIAEARKVNNPVVRWLQFPPKKKE